MFIDFRIDGSLLPKQYTFTGTPVLAPSKSLSNFQNSSNTLDLPQPLIMTLGNHLLLSNKESKQAKTKSSPKQQERLESSGVNS
jgi:hypothetical protein